MTAFVQAPQWQITVKLHFAERSRRSTGRVIGVFSFKRQGQEFQRFRRVFAKSRRGATSLYETVNVNVTTEKLDITFTPNVQKPRDQRDRNHSSAT